jgi:serine/threonine protein kinase
VSGALGSGRPCRLAASAPVYRGWRHEAAGLGPSGSRPGPQPGGQRTRAAAAAATGEYNIHKALRHPHITALADIFEIDNNTFATILELCDGDDLDSHLREHGVGGRACEGGGGVCLLRPEARACCMHAHATDSPALQPAGC